MKIKCSECGATTNQVLLGWNEEWTVYKCGHCKKMYKINKEAEG